MNSCKSLTDLGVFQSLLAFALCLSMMQAVRADDSTFVSEPATIDNSPTVIQDKPSPVSAEPTVLQGGVKKHLHPDDATTTPTAPLAGSATDSGAALQAAQGTIDPAQAFNLAAAKLQSGLDLTSDEYRALGAGCIGYESDRPFFQDIARVSIVYKDSPADKAGIKKGDKMIDHEDDSDARANPSQPRQAFTFDRVGTPVDLTLLRHGKREKITLYRMNIEDIQEPQIRREWEKIIRRLGSPTGGNFTGTSLKNLRRQD